MKKDSWDKLSKTYLPREKESIVIDDIEIFNCWPGFVDCKILIDDADLFEGVRFVKLKDVLSWKIKRGKEKDIKNIKLIENYLNTTEIPL